MPKDVKKLEDFEVPFRDVDMNGEMFRAAYVERAEEAVAALWASRPAEADDPAFTVARVSCTLHEPLKRGDRVRMDVGVSKIGRRSAGFSVRMTRGNFIAAEAEIVWNAVDPETGRPTSLPEELRDWLYQLLD